LQSLLGRAQKQRAGTAYLLARRLKRPSRAGNVIAGMHAPQQSGGARCGAVLAVSDNRRKTMPDIDVDGCPIHVEIDGPDQAPVLMLSNSLGTNLHMWDLQVAPFTKHFRLVRYDRRGHGKSGVTKGPYSMKQLGRDALALLDQLGIECVNWCGLSMGGMVGQWVAAHAPHRIDRLILSNTSSFFPDRSVWDHRIRLVRDKGLAGIVDANMERWFTKAFRESAPPATAPIREMFLATSPEGYIACGEAIRDMDHRALLARIKAPTLVIAGRHDPATPLEMNDFIRDQIPGAELVVLEAAHIANVELPEAYNNAVLGFLLRK
jgi:3-oxoadipate enol-lactonase